MQQSGYRIGMHRDTRQYSLVRHCDERRAMAILKRHVGADQDDLVLERLRRKNTGDLRMQFEEG